VPAFDQGDVHSGYYYARAYPEPVLVSLVKLRPRGLVILAAVSHGASTVQARLYWVARGRLASPRSGLSLGGSVAYKSQANCLHGAGSNLLVETEEGIANDAGTRWVLERRISRLSDRGLEHLRTTKLTVRTKKAEALERRWRLSGQSFFSCTVARGF
jgi:hypothetical protein